MKNQKLLIKIGNGNPLFYNLMTYRVKTLKAVGILVKNIDRQLQSFKRYYINILNNSDTIPVTLNHIFKIPD